MEKLTGNEHFRYNDMPIGKLLSDFWAWNASDLFNNTLRGSLAEFYVFPTSLLNKKCENQKSISLNSLLALNPKKSNFINLGSVVNNILR